jgi:hypothetical protein
VRQKQTMGWDYQISAEEWVRELAGGAKEAIQMKKIGKTWAEGQLQAASCIHKPESQKEGGIEKSF